jgi:hypothetical protein
MRAAARPSSRGGRRRARGPAVVERAAIGAGKGEEGRRAVRACVAAASTSVQVGADVDVGRPFAARLGDAMSARVAAPAGGDVRRTIDVPIATVRSMSSMSGHARHAAAVTWHIDVVLNDAARGVWGRTLTLTLHKRSGESRDHVVLKLLGALLVAGPADEGALVVEAPLRVVGYKPDVVVTGADGRPTAWVEGGDVSVHKLDRLTRALGSDVVVQVLKKGVRPARELARALAAIAWPSRVVVIGVDPDGVDAIGETLNRRSRSAVVATIASAPGDDDGDDDLELAVAVEDITVTLWARRFALT